MLHRRYLLEAAEWPICFAGSLGSSLQCGLEAGADPVEAASLRGCQRLYLAEGRKGHQLALVGLGPLGLLRRRRSRPCPVARLEDAGGPGCSRFLSVRMRALSGAAEQHQLWRLVLPLDLVGAFLPRAPQQIPASREAHQLGRSNQK
jgi:hypothetical protein